MGLGHEIALREMMELNQVGVRLVIMELLANGKLNFPELVEMYVAQLQEENKKQMASLSTSLLHLAGYCMKDKNEYGKTVRRMLYKGQFFKGSPFGDELEKEFSDIDNK